MRKTAIVGLLCLTAACGDDPVEVREAVTADASESEPGAEPGTEVSAEATEEEAEPIEQLEVEQTERGAGAVARQGSVVRLHYEAWLADVHAEGGEPFDSSLSRLIPLELKLGSKTGPAVIPGLEQGLLGLTAGSRAVLRIPAELGWGSEGHEAAGVPADASLVYEVRLLTVR